LTVALIPCFAAVPQSSLRVQGRHLPDCSNYLDKSGVLILSGTCLYAGSATKLADAWHAEGTELQVLINRAFRMSGSVIALMVVIGAGAYFISRIPKTRKVDLTPIDRTSLPQRRGRALYKYIVKR
jgi:hypothetical protein